MALLNIGEGNRDDAFYRYKMPKLMTKIEGRGNGIKTNLVNMVDVAKALARPPSYTTKYFGCELGAQSKFDEKTGIALVNGAHDNSKLVALLEIFIKKYVQCYGCGNPETEILISKTQMISLKCAACGHISDVDMRDKLTTFILKNPPEQKKGGKDKKAMRRAEKERLKAGEAIDEENKKVKKESKKKGHEVVSKVSKKKTGSDEDRSPPGSHVDENEDDDEVQWETNTSLEAAQQRIREQLTSATSEMVMLDTLEEPKPTKKSSGKNEKVEVDKKSKAENGDEVAEKPMEKDVEETVLSKLNTISIHDELLVAFKERLKNGDTPKQLQNYMQSSDGSPQEIMNAYFEALFEGVGKGFSKEVSSKKGYLSGVVQDENSQSMLLGAIEAFCNHARAEAVKEVALVLKTLYDEDILEEDIIFQWYDKGSTGNASQIWKNVKPFVEWLKSAEAESDEE
uniref:W2 domain-containing protein n=1 Tax=Picea sitchensis TaxID=3332 RepID=D5A851_PICSI|nr:unknown [Picea sitchensis]ADE76990.1 unknown [Picea sitchensis]